MRGLGFFLVGMMLLPVGALSDSCDELFKILAVPGVKETLSRLSETREEAKKAGNITKAFAEEAISKKLHELKVNLSQRGVVASIDDLQSLVEKTKRNAHEEKKEEETKPNLPPELPEELRSDHFSENRHHPDYLKAQIPDHPTLKSHGRFLGPTQPSGSDVSWAADGTVATLLENLESTMKDKKSGLAVLKENPHTKEFALIDTDKSHSFFYAPSWGPQGTLAVITAPKSQDSQRGLSVFRVNPLSKKIEWLDTLKFKKWWATGAPAWRKDGLIAVPTQHGLELFKFDHTSQKLKLVDSYDEWRPGGGGPGGFESLEWGPDGALAARRSDGSFRYLKWNAQTQKIESVEKLRGYDFEFGPDGVLAVREIYHDGARYQAQLNLFKYDPSTQKLEQLASRGGFSAPLLHSGATDFLDGKPHWGPDGVLLMEGSVGRGDYKRRYLRVFKFNPQTNALDFVDNIKTGIVYSDLASPAWGPGRLLAVGGKNRVDILRLGSDLKLTRVHTKHTRQKVLGITWGPDGSLLARLDDGSIENLRLTEGQPSWFSTFTDLFKTK